MNRISYTFLWSLCLVAGAGAAERSTTDATGISVGGYRVDGCPILSGQNIPEDSLILDLSDAGRSGQAVLRYLWHGDSTVSEMLPAVRCDFSVCGDSLILHRLEGRTWSLTTDSAVITGRRTPPEERRPGGLCDMRLSRNLSQYCLLRGVWSVSCSFGHTLIPEPGDTLRNVSGLHFRFDGFCYDSSPDFMIADSMAAEHATITRSYLWCDGLSYPQAIADCYAIGNRMSHDMYVFPKSIQSAANVNRAEMPTPDRLFPTRNPAYSPTTRNEIYSPGKNTSMQPSVVISLSAGNVTVTFPDDSGNYSDTADGFAGVWLCDILGRRYPPDTAGGGIATFRNLPAGEYILTIAAADGNISQKLIITAR